VTATDFVLEAYERWAPVYPPVAHNPLMRVEEHAMRASWPDLRGRRVLDLACGSGRYSRLIRASGAAFVVSVDFCLPMLRRLPDSARICASMMRLPFRDGAFEAVICGLAVSHAPAIEEWMNEVTRVLAPGGTLLYSDFHPRASAAGLTRSFKDTEGVTRTVPHRIYGVERQLSAAARAGLVIEEVREPRVGHELTESFPGSEAFYRQHFELPIVVVARARKRPG
jgi:malonyl-CoA O-methyltransferase